MIMAVPTREDEDRLDWQENQGRDTSGVFAAACLGFLAGFAVCAVLVYWR